ncbi:hypothetical protein F5Y07DRAFT_379456 [Xylaria sp. FL0933]|nr:hypothetical protein F5Y07DRAFT_379456 [Xylaria sp. FL0933]
MPSHALLLLFVFFQVSSSLSSNAQVDMKSWLLHQRQHICLFCLFDSYSGLSCRIFYAGPCPSRNPSYPVLHAFHSHFLHSVLLPSSQNCISYLSFFIPASYPASFALPITTPVQMSLIPPPTLYNAMLLSLYLTSP